MIDFVVCAERPSGRWMSIRCRLSLPYATFMRVFAGIEDTTVSAEQLVNKLIEMIKVSSIFIRSRIGNTYAVKRISSLKWYWENVNVLQTPLS